MEQSFYQFVSLILHFCAIILVSIPLVFSSLALISLCSANSLFHLCGILFDHQINSNMILMFLFCFVHLIECARAQKKGGGECNTFSHLGIKSSISYVCSDNMQL